MEGSSLTAYPLIAICYSAIESSLNDIRKVILQHPDGKLISSLKLLLSKPDTKAKMLDADMLGVYTGYPLDPKTPFFSLLLANVVVYDPAKETFQAYVGFFLVCGVVGVGGHVLG